MWAVTFWPFSSSSTKRIVLFAIEGAVEIVVGAIGGFAVARGPEGDGGVDGVGIHDGADAVVEEEPVGAGEAGDIGGEGVAGERTGGDDGDGSVGNGGDFFAAELDERLDCDGCGDFGGEDFAIDGERVAARNAAFCAAWSSSESRRRSSSLSSQGAVDSDSDLSELLQTSSASRSV